MRIYLSFIILLSSFINGIAQQYKAFVIGIKDGDTIVVLDSLKNQHTLRLAEVDCPENGQPFGKNAKQFTSDQVFNKHITYKVLNTDRYGRTIAQVYYDNGKYLSEEIIKHGFGWWYHHYSNNKKLGDLENKAAALKLGLFQDHNAIPPWIYRQQN